MDTYIKEQITNLRLTLHACPEISGQEKQTKETLQEFLKAHTSLELNDCGGGFYAAHREGAGNGIAFRKKLPYTSLNNVQNPRSNAWELPVASHCISP